MMKCYNLRPGDFLGNVEIQRKVNDVTKESRITHLQRTRHEEKSIAARRCEMYRQCIDERKAARKAEKRERILADKLRQQQELMTAWQSSLVETGNSHRAAKEYVIMRLKKEKSDAQINQQRQRVAYARESSAMLKRQLQVQEVRKASLRLLELQQTRQEYSNADREEARLVGEAVEAQRLLLEGQYAMHSRTLYPPSRVTQSKVLQSASSIQQRFPVKVHAHIIRHGAHAADMSSVVWNSARAEENAALRRNWATVMRDMINRINVKRRSLEATATLRKAKRA